MATGLILISLIGLIITVPISALLLMIVSKLFKLSETSYKTAFIVAGLVGVIGFVVDLIASFLSPAVLAVVSVLKFIIVSIFLGIFFVKKYYDLEWGKSFLVWLVWFILSLIVGLVIGLIVAAIALALGLGAALI